MLNLGNVLLLRGDYAAAQSNYESLLRADPDDIDALHNLGVALMNRNRMQEAAGRFRAALAVNPEYSKSREALRRLGESLDER